MANCADPDQLASSEPNWSGSTLFAKAGYIRVQQDKGYDLYSDGKTCNISLQHFSYGKHFFSVQYTCIYQWFSFFCQHIM